MMLDPKQHFSLPYKIIFTTDRSDEHGKFTIQLLDFGKHRDGRVVRSPVGHAQYGWILRCDRPTAPTPEQPLGGSQDDPNLPLVGSEATAQLALARADSVRRALIVPLTISSAANAWSPVCKSCEQPMTDSVFESCTICGAPVCDVCGEKNNGVCGKDVVVDNGQAEAIDLADRAIEREPDERRAHDQEIAARARKNNPMASYVRKVDSETEDGEQR